MNSTAEGRNMEYTKSPLELLDELDAFRRGHQDERLHPSDWCMRCMEAIVARPAALAAAPTGPGRCLRPLPPDTTGICRTLRQAADFEWKSGRNLFAESKKALQ